MRELLSRPHFRVWLAIVGTATIVLAAAYAMVQQSTRLSADDLPNVTAQGARRLIAGGEEPEDAVSTVKVDLKTDDSGFIIITDDLRHVQASTAVLNNHTPLPPAGTFDYAQAHGRDKFTWEPQSGVRLATRIITYKSGDEKGYIITGQSLRPFEDRVDVYTRLAFAAWLATLAWATVILLIPRAGKK
jgi:hypothetical protein